MTSKEVLQKAINTYGVENQMIKTVKELSELSQALCKSLVRLNYTKEKTSLEDDLKSVDNIFKEMADVEIMLEQCKIMFQCDKEVNRWKQKKIERFERRMGEIAINWKETTMIEKEYIEREAAQKVLADDYAYNDLNDFCSYGKRKDGNG